jgi:hypothetical protein
VFRSDAEDEEVLDSEQSGSQENLGDNKDYESHNPKVGGSNPPPATNLTSLNPQR